MLVKPSDIKRFFRDNPDLTSADLAEGEMVPTQLAEQLNTDAKDAAYMAATRARLILRFTAGLRQKLEGSAVDSVEVTESIRSIDVLATEILRIATGE